MPKTSLRSLQSQLGRVVQSGRRSRPLKRQIVRWWMGQEKIYDIATKISLGEQGRWNGLSGLVVAVEAMGMASLQEHSRRR